MDSLCKGKLSSFKVLQYCVFNKLEALIYVRDFNKCKIKHQFQMYLFRFIFVFSNNQQRIQPPFSSSVLSFPLPVKVSFVCFLNTKLKTFICIRVVHNLCFFFLQALSSHPLHTTRSCYANICWPASVQQHAAVHCLYCLLTDRTGLWTFHLWY